MSSNIQALTWGGGGSALGTSGNIICQGAMCELLPVTAGNNITEQVAISNVGLDNQRFTLTVDEATSLVYNGSGSIVFSGNNNLSFINNGVIRSVPFSFGGWQQQEWVKYIDLKIMEKFKLWVEVDLNLEALLV